MTNNMRGRSFTLVISFLLSLAGCVHEEVDTGTALLELTTIGPDGSTYRLPPGTQLIVFGVRHLRAIP